MVQLSKEEYKKLGCSQQQPAQAGERSRNIKSLWRLLARAENGRQNWEAGQRNIVQTQAGTLTQISSLTASTCPQPGLIVASPPPHRDLKPCLSLNSPNSAFVVKYYELSSIHLPNVGEESYNQRLTQFTESMLNTRVWYLSPVYSPSAQHRTTEMSAYCCSRSMCDD